MTITDMLNTEMDFQSIAGLVRRGFVWWLDELATMAPPGLRDRFSSRPRTWIEPRADGSWRVWKDGRPSQASTVAAGGRVGLLAPAGSVLVREIKVPRMPAADVRRLVGLDIERLSPLPPDLIHFDIEIREAAEGTAGPCVSLAVIRRGDAARLLELARASGRPPVAIATLDGAADGHPRFDFLPQTLESLIGPAAGAARGRWWLAAVALILLNLGVLIGRDVIGTARLRETVEAQRPGVDAVLRLRRRVETEDAARRNLLARGKRNDPMRVLAALSQAVPQGAWVQHLEWNGQSLRIVGVRQQDIDMVAAVRGSGMFSNPRPLSVGTAPGGAAARPFDITADTRPEPGE